MAEVNVEQFKKFDKFKIAPVDSGNGTTVGTPTPAPTPATEITEQTPTDSGTKDEVKSVPSSFADQEDVLLDIPADQIEDYLTHLATFGITKDQIFKVLDTIITKGDIMWSFGILGKIPVVLHLRPGWGNDLLYKRIEEAPPKTIAVLNDLIGRYNLAGALVSYNKIKFDTKNEEDFANAMTFIGELPFICKAHLIKQLAIFDRVVLVATSSWAVENFTEPPQAK